MSLDAYTDLRYREVAEELVGATGLKGWSACGCDVRRAKLADGEAGAWVDVVVWIPERKIEESARVGTDCTVLCLACGRSCGFDSAMGRLWGAWTCIACFLWARAIREKSLWKVRRARA